MELRKLLFDSTDALQDLAGNHYDRMQMQGTLADLFGRFERALGKISTESAAPIKLEPPDDDAEEETVLEPTSTLGLDVAVDHRSSIPQELAEIFSQEAEDHLKHIYSSLGALQKHPRDRDVLGNLRRAVHTLKGAAGAVSLKTLTQLAHRMEDVLDQLFEGALPITPTLMKLFFATADALQDLATGNYASDEIRATLAGLYQRYDMVLAPPAGSAQSGSRKRRNRRQRCRSRRPSVASRSCLPASLVKYFVFRSNGWMSWFVW